MWQKIRPYLLTNDSAIGLGLLLVLTLIIVPLPGYILDALIGLSFFSALLIIFTSLSSNKASDFTIFPTLLLLTTIFRLSLNVSTTRMILTKGEAADSRLIQAFGEFVVGDGGTSGYVIGIIIFLILILVQILVITKGATRVSEVAARFALDSMPGKQLAIDSDVAAGYIDNQEARKRREELQKEMGFYGAMDGASKFVQGDVRFGIVMVAINIIGGLVIGMSIRGESFASAWATYARFTIGDGLVTAIPALLVSTATGIIVSNSVAEESLANDIRKQLFANPNILYAVGSIMMLGSFLPGFPTIAMLSIGLFFCFVAYKVHSSSISNTDKKRQESSDKTSTEQSQEKEQNWWTQVLSIEIGYNLIPLIDPKSDSNFLDQVNRLRKSFAMETGLIVPLISIRDSMALDANSYLIRLHGSIIGESTLEPDKLLAIEVREVKEKRTEAPVKDPSFGLKAHWIEIEDKNEAEANGYQIVDPSTVMVTHLSNIIKRNTASIMRRKEVKSMLDSVREEDSIIVDEVLNEKKMGLGKIQAVLANLLKENISIRSMPQILTILSDNAEQTRSDPTLLSEAVRANLKRQIVSPYLDKEQNLFCILISPGLDNNIRNNIQQDPTEGFVMTHPPAFQEKLAEELAKSYKIALKKEQRPIFLCSRAIRMAMFHFLERRFDTQNFSVLAYDEIPNDVQVKQIETVDLNKKEDKQDTKQEASPQNLS